MPDALVSFRVAVKKDYYEINKLLYEKITERESKVKPESVRAMCGDRLAWFLPAPYFGVASKLIDMNLPRT